MLRAMFASCEVVDLEPEAWHGILTEFDDASIYQTRSYGVKHWSARELKYLICRRDGRVASAAQLRVLPLPFWGPAIAYVRYGPLWRRRGIAADPENFRIAIEALAAAMDEGLFRTVKLLPNIDERSDYAATIRAALEREGFVASRVNKPYRSFFLNVEPPLTSLREGLDQKWRNRLNRGERNGLSFESGTSDRLFQVFMDLQGSMVVRKKFHPAISYEEFRRIQEDLPEKLKMMIFACADRDGTALASAIASKIGDSGIYVLGATGDAGLKSQGAYCLQWRIIEWLKREGAQVYDLGGIDARRNPGVYSFKKGLGGAESTFIGEYDRRPATPFSLAIALLERGRAFLRHR